ncbi:MAG: Unknown protein [uncultured Sulfurovum sp.]|uniref:MOSC domain-containing protein n=1 Tax=uncultured Sulfurovum sp. TaxID=269237 RepID=A0A6S6SL69_9BACT|nr:MAG: Unknown protein [uncultured Sulfurovum sp.]
MNKNVGEVKKIFLSKKNESERLEQTSIRLDNNGVIGDKFYAKDINRSILLTSLESYTLVKENNIKISHGALGENILIDFNPYYLSTGTRIKIGEVIIEITQNCTICNHLSIIDESLPVLLKDDRGIFVKVMELGSIQKGDKVYLLE